MDQADCVLSSTNLVKQQAEWQERFRSHKFGLRFRTRHQCSKQSLASLLEKVAPVTIEMMWVRVCTIKIVAQVVCGLTKYEAGCKQRSNQAAHGEKRYQRQVLEKASGQEGQRHQHHGRWCAQATVTNDIIRIESRKDQLERERHERFDLETSHKTKWRWKNSKIFYQCRHPNQANFLHLHCYGVLTSRLRAARIMQPRTNAKRST